MVRNVSKAEVLYVCSRELDSKRWSNKRTVYNVAFGGSYSAFHVSFRQGHWTASSSCLASMRARWDSNWDRSENLSEKNGVFSFQQLKPSKTNFRVLRK